jgi:hypothetical protein
MEDVKLDKQTVIDRVKANLETHETAYLAAVEEYRRQQTELLEELLAKAKAGTNLDRLALSRMPVPEDHSDDYRVALQMLEHEQRKSIVLAQHEYRQLMNDEWEWRRNWASNTESYSIAAANRG